MSQQTEERELEVMTSPCECEHIDHFENPGSCHEYGKEIDIELMTAITTPHGPFIVCVDCRRTHLTDDVLR